MSRITLAQRPEGVRLTVQELLERVRSGRIRVQNIVAAFVAQRARWGENDRPSLDYLAADSTQS